MKHIGTLIIVLSLSAALFGQGRLDPAKLLQPPTDSWPTYHGDCPGRRYSAVKQLNDCDVDSRRMAWVYRVNTGVFGGRSITATPLQINGVLYFALPDHVWAVDARTGREIWHHAWQSKGGTHVGNRGVGVFRDWLYFETPDCNLVSLNLKDGKERWRKTIGELDQCYYGSLER